MPSPRGKRVAVLVAIGAVLAVGVAAYAFRNRIQEEYWLWRLERGDQAERTLAAKKLGEMGSVRVVQKLAECMKRDVKGGGEATNFESTKALIRIGAPSVAVLSIAVRYEQPWQARQAAAKVLREIGPRAHAALPDLITGLGDAEPGVRAAVAEAIGAMGPLAKSASPTLIGTLKDENDWVRRQAAQALRQVGGGGREAVPALTASLKDKNPEVRQMAAEALAKLGSEANDAISALEEAQRDENADVRYAASKALSRIRG